MKALGDLFRSPTIEPSAFALDQQFLTDWLSRPFDHPAGIVAHVTRKKLLGALHPYAEPYGGTVAEVRALKIADVLAAFRRIAEPRRIRIATAGSCDPDKIRSRLERAFGDLRGDARSAAALPAIPALPTTSPARRVYVVDRPQSALSHVRWAWTGATASERFTLRVLQMWAHLRAYERLAKATDLTEDFDVGFGGDHAGLWLSIGGRVVSARTAELLAEIGRLVDEVGAASSTAAIQTAKARLLGGQAMTYERARDVSRLLARDTFGDFQGDPLARIEAGAAAVTTADVQALAKRMLSSRTGTVVIVGDEATVRAPLAASGWGAPETCDPDGNPLKH